MSAVVLATMSERVPGSASTPLSAWLAELAQPSGAPGGGAASGVMLATSAALLRMVAEYTPEPQASECAERLVSRRRDALDAGEADGLRSAEFGAALSQSPDDPERDGRVRDAAVAAARSSVLIGEVGRGLLTELRLLTRISNPQLAADLAVAAAALDAGITGASINLRANLRTARTHGAPQPTLTELHAEVRRLAADRAAVADIAERVSATFDR